MKDLIDFLRRKLSPEDLALLRAELDGPGEVDYDALVRRVASRVKKDEDQFSFARSRLQLRYTELLELPEGRRLTLLRNSSPVLLLVFFRELLKQSWADRFSDAKRSLRVAGLAFQVAEAAAASAYLGEADTADLFAEVYAYLGNARRINADLPGAQQSLHRAERHLAAGSGDRSLKADFLMLLASLRTTQGRGLEAAALLDREIVLRRLLGDQSKLGFSLVQRGWVACMIGEARAQITDYFQAGLSLVPDDQRLVLQALHAYAEYLAREGQASAAWKMLVSAETPLQALNEDVHHTDHRWIAGLAHRTVREMEQAERMLSSVQEHFAESGSTHKLAMVSVDLASVYAAQGRFNEAEQAVDAALRIFQAEGLEDWALKALVILQDALKDERATEGLAIAVGNFLARFPYNKSLRFEWKDD